MARITDSVPDEMPAIANNGSDAPLLWEQMRNVGGGMDAFSDPVELDGNACQKLINILVRDKAKARTRPGADALGGVSGAALLADDGTPLLNDDGTPLVADEDTSTFGGAFVHGLFYFDTPDYEQLIGCFNNRFLKWNNSEWTTMAGYDGVGAARVAMAQGIDKLLVSNGTDEMQIWDGAAWSSSLGSGNTDPPVGATILCWHAGRMFASGVATDNDTIWTSTLLDFGAGAWNGTTKSFRIGRGDGDPIRALKSFVGFTLAVGKENSIWLVETDPASEPEDWSALPLGESVSFGSGVCGPMAWDVFGNDIFLVSPDLQIRTLRRMAAASGQYELSAPLSEPMQPYIDRINPSYLQTIAVKKYQELILFAVPLDSAESPDHVLVYNGRLGRWIGVWTGWTPTMWEITRFAGVSQLVFGDASGYVNQWKDRSGVDNDDTYLDNGADIATSLYTRNLSFGDIEADKVAFNARLRFNRGNAELSVTAIGDDADMKQWTATMSPGGGILGVDVLPFQLATSSPSLIAASLRDWPSFREMYLKIESDAGWWELRNLSVSARQRPMKSK